MPIPTPKALPERSLPDVSRRADFLSKLNARTRQRYGTDVVIAGRTYRMTTRSLERREREYVPDGPRNAAATDARLFGATPADFPVLPKDGSTLMWQGEAYTILTVRHGDDAIGGTAVTLEFFAYRKPPAGQDPREDAQIAQWPAPPA